MSATATATPVRADVTASAGPLTGTAALVRFVLRRDRVRIPVWLGALVLGTVSTAASFETTYPEASDRQATAEAMSSPAALAMTGPGRYLEEGYSYGAMMGHQMIGFVVVLVGLMSVLMVVRHTRAEEESGRAELVRAAIVGRHAHMAAALTVAVATNVALAVLLWAGLGSLGMAGITWSGSLLYGAAHAAVGIVFAGVAAVTVQITEHSRGASGMALAAVGAAFVLRAAGDVGSGVLSWLSPIGWAQRTYVYVDNRWWPLVLAVALTVVLVAVSVLLSTRRDVGAGLRPPRLGRSEATPMLTRPLGFALRLHRGLLIGFAVGMLLLGTSYGSILGDAEEMLSDIETFDEMLAQIGGQSIAESYASMVMVVVAIIASIYVVLAANRLRSEESAGRAEPVLATGLSRTRWVASHVAVALGAGVVMLLAAGLGIGLMGAMSLDDESIFWRLLGAAVAYTPALWIAVGVAVALVGWLPRAATAAWIVPLYAFIVDYLGEILQFPDWVQSLSPFDHIPRLPADDMTWTPLLILTAIAAALIAVGVVGFNRRDLEAV